VQIIDGKLTVLCFKQSRENRLQSALTQAVTLNHVQITTLTNERDILRFLQEQPCDLFLYMLSSPSWEDTEAAEHFLGKIIQIYPGPITFLDPHPSPSLSKEGFLGRIKGVGTLDYLTGVADEVALLTVCDRLLAARPALSPRSAFSKWGKGYLFQKLVGKSPAMLKVFSMIERMAPYHATVLITGETGTGKDGIARAIHELSPRRAMRFVTCNCAALPESLLESELFGHVKGAFTGAMEQRDGLFRHSRGGTLFLDEVGEMPLSLQAKLLRVIEEQSVRPVGSDRLIPIDARLVVATNKDLWKAVQAGTFRRDLFYRLNVASIETPPLRERREDIPLLCDYFLDQIRQKNHLPIKGFSEEARQLLISFDWPGNVRELKNVLESAALMATEDRLAIHDFPPHLQEYAILHQEKILKSSKRLNALERREKSVIEETISRCSGNKVRAAEALGLSRRALYRRLEKYELSS
jgi:transcriptional regulator with PAS, ATPase and Fis domain